MNKNIFKTWMLMAGFFVFVIFVGFVFAQVFHNPGILYFAVILSLIMNAASYRFSDKIALAVSGAKPADKKQYPALYEIVARVAGLAEIPMPRVYIISDASPNAFATGRNPKNAVMAVTTGLMEKLDRSELEGLVRAACSRFV